MRTALFIHGMFMTADCWEAWVRYFAARGYRALAPGWPEHLAPVDAQRRAHPNPKLAALTLADLVEHHRRIVASLDSAPVLIGHSMGGLIVQLLLQQNLGRAGVAIDSAPPKGVLSFKWSFLKSNWPAINPFADPDEPIFMSPAQFRYAFAHRLSAEDAQKVYDRHVVPESRRVGKGPTTGAAHIDFARTRPPLLLIAGAQDRIIPASLNRSNHARYAKSPSVTDFHEFPGRTHYILGQNGWEEVADFTLEWLARNVPI